MSLMPPGSDDLQAIQARQSPFSTPPGSSGGEDEKQFHMNTARRVDPSKRQGSPYDPKTSTSSDPASQPDFSTRKLIDVPSSPMGAAAPPLNLPPRREPSGVSPDRLFRPSSKPAEGSVASQAVSGIKVVANPAPVALNSAVVNTRTNAGTPRNLAVESAKQAFPTRSNSPLTGDPLIPILQPKDPFQADEKLIQFGGGDASEFPDFGQSNRRPPKFQFRPWEIDVAYETKLFASGGRYLCTGGFGVKVWNVITGELLVSVNHEDTVKTSALCVRPGGRLDQFGAVFWLGTNMGDIMELSVEDGYITNSRSHAHGRADIIKMHTSGSEVWSIDIDGKLQVWTSRDAAEPSLDGTPTAFRVPKPYSASVVVKGNLWYASGKEIRVVFPHESQDERYDVLGRSLTNGNSGEITDAALGGTDADRVFFSHTDGKVSIYSAGSYACLGAVTITQSRLSTVTAVGSDLWVGFNSGMIFVYDTAAYPWRIKKDWLAHRDGVATLAVDETSIFQTDRCQVISLGADLTVKFWDGLLQDDYTDELLSKAESSFSTTRTLSCAVATWNAGAAAPEEVVYETQSNLMVDSLLSGETPPDILVFGLQELVDLEDTKTTALSFFSSRRKKITHHHDHVSKQYSAWREHLTDCLYGRDPDGESYYLLKQDSLVGLFSAVFVRSSLHSSVSNLHVGTVKRGLGGLHGNKGAIVIRFLINDTSVCLVNAHLAAGQKETTHRNSDITAILEHTGLQPLQPPASNVALRGSGGDGSMILDHDIVIFNGDLNYRLDSMTRDLILRTLGTSNAAASTFSATISSHLPPHTLAKLLSRDQLLMSVRRNPQFRLRALKEGEITFAPTYKYDVGTDRYDNSEKKRPPAWCDRILYRGSAIWPDRERRPDWYRRVEGLRVSDHRPVIAEFLIRVRKVEDWGLWNAAKERAEREIRERKRRVWEEGLGRVLAEGYGVERGRARELARGAGSFAEVVRTLERGR